MGSDVQYRFAAVRLNDGVTVEVHVIAHAPEST